MFPRYLPNLITKFPHCSYDGTQCAIAQFFFVWRKIIYLWHSNQLAFHRSFDVTDKLIRESRLSPSSAQYWPRMTEKLFIENSLLSCVIIVVLLY